MDIKTFTMSCDFSPLFSRIRKTILAAWFAGKSTIYWLVVLTILKNMKVNGKDYPIYYGKYKMVKTTNQFSLILPADHPEGCGSNSPFRCSGIVFIETSHGGFFPAMELMTSDDSVPFCEVKSPKDHPNLRISSWDSRKWSFRKPGHWNSELYSKARNDPKISRKRIPGCSRHLEKSGKNTCPPWIGGQSWSLPNFHRHPNSFFRWFPAVRSWLITTPSPSSWYYIP